MPSTKQGAITKEIPAVGNGEDDEDEDAWNEIPTVSNRTGPTSGTRKDESPSPAPPEGAGTYRIVRPATSDVIDTPAPTQVDPRTPKRTVIGPSGKPKP